LFNGLKNDQELSGVVLIVPGRTNDDCCECVPVNIVIIPRDVDHIPSQLLQRFMGQVVIGEEPIETLHRQISDRQGDRTAKLASYLVFIRLRLSVEIA
jgi:hypothetical protein